MARFELDDGTLQKFWEIELDGEFLRFRYGDVGSPGRTRSKRHATEQKARHAHEAAVRSMLEQGYVRSIAPQEPQVAAGPAWASLEADPSDRASLAVHADWLQSNDDPRGEFLSTQLAALDAEGSRRKKLDASAAALLEASLERFVGGTYEGEHTFTWGLGYLETVRFDMGSPDPSQEASTLLGSPGFRLLRDLTLRVPSAVQVVLGSTLPALRRLAIHTSVTEADGDRLPLDLDKLRKVAPRLKHLIVRGQAPIVGAAALEGLRTLDVRWTDDWRKTLRGVRVPATAGLHGIDAEALVELNLAGVSSLTLAPSWGADTQAMVRNLRGGSLRQLSLDSIEVDAKLAAILVGLDLSSLDITGAITPKALAKLKKAELEPGGGWKLVQPDDVDADPRRPNDLVVSRFINRSARGSWYWEIGVDGAVHHVRYGRDRNPGRWVWRRFPSEDVAEEMAQRRIDEKLREGYQPVE